MRQAVAAMIRSIGGQNFTRAEFRNSVHYLACLMIMHKYNPNAIDDLFKSVWHPYLRFDGKYDRMVVVPPPEILERCYKIGRSRKRSGQKEDEIEAVITEWCGDHYVRPTKVVFTNKAAVLFFDNDSEAVFARCALLEFTRDFVNRCWDAT